MSYLCEPTSIMYVRMIYDDDKTDATFDILFPFILHIYDISIIYLPDITSSPDC